MERKGRKKKTPFFYSFPREQEMSRPEHKAPPEVFYGMDEAAKYANK